MQREESLVGCIDRLFGVGCSKAELVETVEGVFIGVDMTVEFGFDCHMEVGQTAGVRG